MTRHRLASSPGVVPKRARSIPVWATMVVATIGVASLACSQADSQRVAPPAAIAGGGRTGGAPAGPLGRGAAPLLTGGAGYRTVRVAASGRISGAVEFTGPAPADSIVHPGADADVCGAAVVDVSVDHRGPRLASAIVWLSGVSAGKALPVVRRFDITSAGCRFVPRVQTAIVGGTLDVRNADATTHHSRFDRQPPGAPLAVIPETEAGAVVPSAAVLASPGLVQVRCDDHPWARGWIAVFDHPYFAATDATGAFTIDSVPPGRYRISVWHERFGTKTDSVTVTAGQDATIALRY